AEGDQAGGRAAAAAAATDALGENRIRTVALRADETAVDDLHGAAVTATAAAAAHGERPAGAAGRAAAAADRLREQPARAEARRRDLRGARDGDRTARAAAPAGVPHGDEAARGSAEAAAAADGLRQHTVSARAARRDRAAGVVRDRHRRAVAPAVAAPAEGGNPAGGTAVTASAADALREHAHAAVAVRDNGGARIVRHGDGPAVTADRGAAAQGGNAAGVAAVAARAADALGEDAVARHGVGDDAAVVHARDAAAVATVLRAAARPHDAPAVASRTGCAAGADRVDAVRAVADGRDRAVVRDRDLPALGRGAAGTAVPDETVSAPARAGPAAAALGEDAVRAFSERGDA